MRKRAYPKFQYFCLKVHLFVLRGIVINVLSSAVVAVFSVRASFPCSLLPAPCSLFRSLSQYSAFVAKVRGYESEGYNLQEAVNKAVVYCRDHDILKELLEENASEVLNMLMTKWNLDDAKQVWFEDGMEEGMEKGKNESREEIARNALTRGIPIEMICDITGLDMEAIERLAQ